MEIPPMKNVRVLVACEPTSYREAIAEVLGQLRPEGVEVHEAAPEDLDREVARLRPGLTVCSRVTRRIADLVPYWIELHPGLQARSVVGARGGRAVLEALQLSDIVELVDRCRMPAAAS